MHYKLHNNIFAYKILIINTLTHHTMETSTKDLIKQRHDQLIDLYKSGDYGMRDLVHGVLELNPLYQQLFDPKDLLSEMANSDWVQTVHIPFREDTPLIDKEEKALSFAFLLALIEYFRDLTQEYNVRILESLEPWGNQVSFISQLERPGAISIHATLVYGNRAIIISVHHLNRQ